ncbi:P27 family phage terminase small subunit [Aeromonas caviae]|uniref:P27 family phage terminase small subunit n=1 Tax=Aeromonas caviae TaxID=648 RepID=UPI002B48EF38|nr:P27 family phage terminase small subunit [Aeromonas caviae]
MALSSKDKNKITSLIKVDQSIKQLTSKLTNIIEAERNIRPSELMLVQMLAVQTKLFYDAYDDISVNGSKIYSENRDGPVTKENPSCRIMANASVQIMKLQSELGISEMSYQKITGQTDNADEEDNTLKNALENLYKDN